MTDSIYDSVLPDSEIEEIVTKYREEVTAASMKARGLLRSVSQARQLSDDLLDANLKAKVDEVRMVLNVSPRRRLEAEEIHDALLLVSGALDPTLGGQSNTRTGRPGSEGEDAFLKSDPSQRRGIYQPIYRGGMAPDLFRVFDFPDAGLVTGSRNVTTVATQALFLLNSPEMLGQARRTAARLLAERSEDAGRVQRLHQWLFGRDATVLEVQRARDFLKAAPGSQDAAWAALCHSLMISTPFLFVE